MYSSSDKKFLFVTGIQRSGTTALANTLNWHSEITVCIERFKYLINKNKIHLFTPDLFAQDALLDFSSNYTNCTPDHSNRFADFYKDLGDKYSNLKYVGDKIANDPGQIPRIHDTFPNAKIIYIVRDIFEVAHSWQTRADREGDNWPAHKTAECAVTPWNEFNAQVLSMWESYPDDIYVVNYQKFFSEAEGKTDQLNRLLSFLNLSADSGIIEGYDKARTLYARNIKNKQRQLEPNIVDRIAKSLNHDLYRNVCSITETEIPLL